MNFNHWDIILAIPLLYAAWKGFMNGFIIEVASIVALVAGIYLAANGSEWSADKLQQWFDLEGTWLGYLAFFLTFVAVVIGVYALAKVVEKAVNLAALKLVNKLFGSLFGTVKMILILSIILNLLSWMDQHIPLLSRTQPAESMLFGTVLGTAPLVMPVLTEAGWMQKAEQVIGPLFEPEEDASEEEERVTTHP